MTPPASGSPPLPELEDLRTALRDRLRARIFCLSHSWGGLEQVAFHDTLDLAAQGLEVALVCLPGTPIAEAAAKAGLARHELPHRPRNLLDASLRHYLREERRRGANLIHTHQTSVLGSISPWLWADAGASVFATRHILNSHSKRSLWHRAVYARLDALIVMSQALRANVLATHAIKPRRVRVIHLGLDYDRFDPEKVRAKDQREAWGADEDTCVIGMVGRLDPAKGQATFLKAAAGLRRLAPERKLRFVIVGEETLAPPGEASRGGSYLEELRGLAAQLQLQDSVVFAGYRENVPEAMAAFDLFVMPSRQEAFGLVAIEAMAMETPIVISAGGSAEEIVGRPAPDRFSPYGVLVRPEDAFDLQGALKRLLDDPERGRSMGRAARSFVRAEFDRWKRLRQTLTVYERSLRWRESRS